MPNITFYISAAMPPEATLARLSDDCMQLCTKVLAASKQNVHVIYVETLPGHGLPVFVEVQYRLEHFRSPCVMERFMQGLQESILQHTALQARIRCFGHEASRIHALH
ncbi:hypothetical protein [Comamonas guangdongensis]|uniref:Uncharacterized protein n=1 Tax=Comamonas guangdongensis TaxID=510515 RepID=A0ABV4A090_9BURK